MNSTIRAVDDPVPVAAVRDIDWLIGKLKPFAKVADEYHASESDGHAVWIDAGPIRLVRGSFALGNYRGAREALIELERIKALPHSTPAEVVRSLMEQLPEPSDRTEYGQGSASGIERAAAELDRREALADLKSPDRRGAAMRLAFQLGRFDAQWEIEIVAYPGTDNHDIDLAIVMDAVAACGLVGVVADPAEICRSIDEKGRSITLEPAQFDAWYASPTFQAITHGDKAVVVVPYDPYRPDAADRLIRYTDAETNVCIVTIKAAPKA